ncbi:MAG: ABC transporter ATP-binding protein [Deltaproteobacteria bacterium]|nr:ABC transporter ATP-binding protein [Deltaproteobacteria bacterium]
MTYYFTSRGLVKAVRGVEFSLDEGESLALVGESGCGKSVTALSILRLVSPPGKIVEGVVRFQGEDLRRLPSEELRRIRGNRIGMIFQEPTTSLNPVLTVGDQIAEVLRLHLGQDRREALDGAAELLHQVGIPAAGQRLRDYPHQLSGGMRQRVMIAMALACRPALLIADEPTTALDVTIQAQILDLLDRFKRERRMAMLLISHDLGVVAQSADRVAIMNAGLIMEYAPVRALYSRPLHPYTQGLLHCVPRLGRLRERLRPMAWEPGAGGQSFLDRCPPPFSPQGGKIPPLREVAAGHWVRCWEL